jgi:hypothetical protein
MRKSILAALIFLSLSDLFGQSSSDYKISEFSEFGWYYCSIVNKSNMTLILYANKNEYHKSGNPIYILQGTIGLPDKYNTKIGDGDPQAGVFKFKVLYSDPSKKDFIPTQGTIWYKINKFGKDRLEMEAGEATLSILNAK